MAEQGMIIGGKYEILKEIGQGGMSIVYLAMDKNLNKQWAVKEVRHDVYGEEREVIVQSLLTEASMMKKLDHPILPRIVDIIGRDYVVMDYIEGETLEDVLKNFGAQKQEHVIEWGKTLCEVLDYFHTRVPPIIYRDMKPSNIKLRPDGSIRLFDLGIAHEYKQENLEDTTQLGTRGYAAPEQFKGKGKTDARTDVYSLGITLHHLVTGKNPCEPPYELYPIRHWNPALSSGLELIIQKSTQLNPEDRFQSCAEMLYALENVEKYSSEYKTKQKKKIHRFTGVLIASAVSLAVGVWGTVLYNEMKSQDYEANLETGTVEGYKNAIKIEPSRADAYEDWINLYMENRIKADGVERKEYTADEAEKLESIFDKDNLNQLKKKDPEGYAQVCYDTGKLNWYFYTNRQKVEGESSNAEQIDRMVRSIKWFEMVKNLNSETEGKKYLNDRDRACVECYYNIGGFFRDRESAEIGDTGGEKIYQKYFEDIMTLIETIGIDKPKSEGDNSDIDVIMRVQMYDLILYSLDSDIELFKNQGVSRQDIQKLYGIVAENTEELEPDRKKELETKAHIMERLDSVQKKIDMAYGGKEDANE